MITSHTYKLAERVVDAATKSGSKISTAESCTGGLVAAYLTSVPGSSKIFEEGFVVYSNRAKNKDLGVSNEILNRFGAVSNETAIAMLESLLKYTGADYGISVTGIAGPAGDEREDTIGLVYIGYGSLNNMRCAKFNFNGDREAVREQAAQKALSSILFEIPNKHS